MNLQRMTHKALSDRSLYKFYYTFEYLFALQHQKHSKISKVSNLPLRTNSKLGIEETENDFSKTFYISDVFLFFLFFGNKRFSQYLKRGSSLRIYYI